MSAPDLGPKVDIEQIGRDHGMAQARNETTGWSSAGLRYGVSWCQGNRKGWWDAVEWVLTEQAKVNELTPEQIVVELRKGGGSIYWPLFVEDPAVFADCPHCEEAVVFQADGECPVCGAQIVEVAA